MPPTVHKELKIGGGFSDYKKSRGDRRPINMSIFIIIRHKNRKIKLHLDYKGGFSFTKAAFRFQKLRFVYKYSLLEFKSCISFYKVASHLAIKQGEGDENEKQ